MKITNITGLPSAIAQAVRNDPYPHGQVGDISVSALCNPPQLQALWKFHQEELSEDAADRIWALFGQVMHSILERAEPSEITEHRFFTEVEGWTISGQIDRLTRVDEGSSWFVIEDYKTTSAWAVLDGPKPEWQRQLHILQYLAEVNSFNVCALKNIVLLRDWSRGKALSGGNYPQSPVLVLATPTMEMDALKAMVAHRVRLHQEAWSKVNLGQDLPPCTPEERWAKPDTFAVMKVGRKSAVRLFTNLKTARDHAAADSNYYIVTRPGESTRCKDYCAVANFCKQRQAELAASAATE